MGIYLDNASTTLMSAAALNEYQMLASDFYGNPQGNHAVSRLALRKLDEYRQRASQVLGCAVSEVYFTSGATESNNLALLGSHRKLGDLACSAIEHKAVLSPVEYGGGEKVPVSGDGMIDQDLFRDYLKEKRGNLAAVSIMAVNNEIGVINPIPIFAGMVHKHSGGAIFHCDGVQASQILNLAPIVASVDCFSLSGHKFNGPKGTGILVVKEGTALRPIVRGGSQERDIRPGTHDLPSIGAMVVALEEAQSQRSITHEYLIKIRDLFEERLTALLPNVSVNALNGDRSPAISNLLFPGTTNEEMLYLLDGAGVYASGGAACASGALDPSHVIMALGVDKLLAKSALRFSFSTSNTAEEIIEASEIVAKVYSQLTGGQL